VARVSGPLLARIDLHVGVPAVSWSELEAGSSGPGSAELRDVVARARRTAERRLAGTGARTNAELPDSDLERLVRPTAEARALLGRAVERLGLSARAARRVLRVARSVADLAGEASVGPRAVAEVLGYRDGVPGEVARET
jgi:magnesium chelatase family protein